jgi:hypothetical protein
MDLPMRRCGGIRSAQLGYPNTFQKVMRTAFHRETDG